MLSQVEIFNQLLQDYKNFQLSDTTESISFGEYCDKYSNYFISNKATEEDFFKIEEFLTQK
jgi:hypothetical protein